MKTVLRWTLKGAVFFGISGFAIGVSTGLSGNSRCTKDLENIYDYAEKTANSRISQVYIGSILTLISPGVYIGMYITEDYNKCK